MLSVYFFPNIEVFSVERDFTDPSGRVVSLYGLPKIVFLCRVKPVVVALGLVCLRRSFPKIVFSSRDSEISWPRLLYVRNTVFPKIVNSFIVLNGLCLNNSRQFRHFLGRSQPLCLHLICVLGGITKLFPQWLQDASFCT